VPVYFGKENEPLEPSKCGCILIQVKNRDDAATPEAIFQEEFVEIENQKTGNGSTSAYLSDLGQRKPSIY
jgi:hypothetical protein